MVHDNSAGVILLQYNHNIYISMLYVVVYKLKLIINDKRALALHCSY